MISPYTIAYADPGTGMLLWQVLSAFAIGFAFYFKTIFRWVKSLFTKNKKSIKNK